MAENNTNMSTNELTARLQMAENIKQRDGVIHNPEMYKNVPELDDMTELVKLDLENTEGSKEREQLNNDIKYGTWRKRIPEKDESKPKEETKKREKDYKVVSKKVKDEIDKLYPEDTENFVKDLFPKIDKNDLNVISKLISKQLALR